ncbi:hypothetical protein MMC12_008667 [Toensbergia leucococca]|nr:hypothetical protein [Toensbergia leucococca]
MALLSLKTSFFSVLLCVRALAQAATITYDFNITWVMANPDGAFNRPTIGINGQWPLPQITATVGDRVIVNVNNQLGNQTTSLHFHGLYMNGTTEMDGVVGVSQCAIPPGGSFKYDFQINQPGTYWYHSHNDGQYPDGLRGALIVNDPVSPYLGQYDEEIVLTISDWYHDQMQTLIKSFINVENPTGVEPVPNAALLNDAQNLTVSVEPSKTYLFRMINVGAYAGQYLWFEGHTMRIVEVDGIYTEPADAKMIYITAAQRYSVLLTTKNDTSANFAFVSSMDEDLFDRVPPTLNPNVTGWLMYDATKQLPTPALLDKFDPFDDFTLVPTDGEELLDNVDHSITLRVKMENLGPNAGNPFVYGTNTNAFILNKNKVIEIVVNNDDPGKHPFHLHGHNFQAVVRSEESAGIYIGNETLPKIPMRRDTFMVRPNGNIVLRFRADNPDKSHPAHLILSTD